MGRCWLEGQADCSMDEATSHRGERLLPLLRQTWVSLGAVLCFCGAGCNLAYPAPLLHQLAAATTATAHAHTHNHTHTHTSTAVIRLSTYQQSWLVSVLGVGMTAGLLGSVWALAVVGRRAACLAGCALGLAGWALVWYAPTATALVVARVLLGLAMGMHAPAAPLAVAEWASAGARPVLLSLIAVAFSAGMLGAHVAGALLPWRTAALVCGSVYLLAALPLTCAPDTPAFLASRQRYAAAQRAFRWLRGTQPRSEQELTALLHSQRERFRKAELDGLSQDRGKAKLLKSLCNTLRTKECFKPLLIMSILYTLFQVSGVTVIPSYCVQILELLAAEEQMEEQVGEQVREQVGEQTEADKVWQVVSVDAVRLGAAALSCVVLGAYGRRPVLWVAAVLSVVGLGALSVGGGVRWLLLAVAGHGAGLLPVPWAVAAEIFPLRVRAVGAGLAGGVLALLLAAVLQLAALVLRSLGVRVLCALHALAVLPCCAALYWLLPETRGKTLQEIEMYFTASPVPPCSSPAASSERDHDRDRVTLPLSTKAHDAG